MTRTSFLSEGADAMVCAERKQRARLFGGVAIQGGGRSWWPLDRVAKRLAMTAMLVVLSVGGHAQTPAPMLPNATPETLAAAHELTEATGAAKLASTMIGLLRNQVVASIARGGKSAEEAGKIVDELLLPEMQSRIGELADLIAEVYANNYSVDEMHQLIEFYRSPLGKRMLELAPQIGQQSVIAGQTWGRRVAQDALTKNAGELKRRGVQL